MDEFREFYMVDDNGPVVVGRHHVRTLSDGKKGTSNICFDGDRDYVTVEAPYAEVRAWLLDGKLMEESSDPLLKSDDDEKLMRGALLKCYGTKTLAFRVSVEHYRHLAEQIVALREHVKRIGGKRAAATASDVETAFANDPNADLVLTFNAGWRAAERHHGIGGGE